jgi:hypothetical protein
VQNAALPSQPDKVIIIISDSEDDAAELGAYARTESNTAGLEAYVKMESIIEWM